MKKPKSTFLISAEKLDVLSELFLIGSGRAAQALNRMITKKIKLSIPEISVIELNELPSILQLIHVKVATVSMQFDLVEPSRRESSHGSCPPHGAKASRPSLSLCDEGYSRRKN